MEEQKKSIDYLRKQIEILDERISELENQIHLTQKVNSLLQTKIDNLEQYSRRPCRLIDELEEPEDEDVIVIFFNHQDTGISRNTVLKNQGKPHLISQVDDAGK